MNSEFIIKSLMRKVEFWLNKQNSHNFSKNKDKNTKALTVTNVSETRSISKDSYWNWLDKVIKMTKSGKNKKHLKQKLEISEQNPGRTVEQAKTEVTLTRHMIVKDYLITKTPLALQYVDMVMDYLEQFNYLHLDLEIIANIAHSIRGIEEKFEIGFCTANQVNYKLNKQNQYPIIEKYRHAQTTRNYWVNKLKNEGHDPQLGL